MLGVCSYFVDGQTLEWPVEHVAIQYPTYPDRLGWDSVCILCIVKTVAAQ